MEKEVKDQLIVVGIFITLLAMTMCGATCFAYLMF